MKPIDVKSKAEELLKQFDETQSMMSEKFPSPDVFRKLKDLQLRFKQLVYAFDKESPVYEYISDFPLPFRPAIFGDFTRQNTANAKRVKYYMGLFTKYLQDYCE